MTDLIPLYRAMAEGGGVFHGNTIANHAKGIGEFLRQHRCNSLIDWGCGRADAYRSPTNVWKGWRIRPVNIVLYDPAFSAHSRKPRRAADAVVCSDVLEHIPEPEVGAFIDELFAHARKCVWASVCCRPAEKTFPDGTNLHVTLHPLEWWCAEFASRAGTKAFRLVETL